MTASIPSLPRLEELTENYKNSADHNDALFARLTNTTWSDEVLSEHRRYIENNNLGFGDAAFHLMWAIVIEPAADRFRHLNGLEIGVFKGQVISLWALIARARGFSVNITITPLRGKPLPSKTFVRRVRYLLSKRFREQVEVGNFYANDDYIRIISDLFRRFHLDISVVRFYRGLSYDRDLLSQIEDCSYQVVYVDGDHSYEAAKHDFLNFGSKVVPGVG